MSTVSFDLTKFSLTPDKDFPDPQNCLHERSDHNAQPQEVEEQETFEIPQRDVSYFYEIETLIMSPQSL